MLNKRDGSPNLTPSPTLTKCRFSTRALEGHVIWSCSSSVFLPSDSRPCFSTAMYWACTSLQVSGLCCCLTGTLSTRLTSISSIRCYFPWKTCLGIGATVWSFATLSSCGDTHRFDSLFIEISLWSLFFLGCKLLVLRDIACPLCHCSPSA